jgi:hypothetical protein
MRKTSITVHNTQRLDVFIEKRRNGFQLWIVGVVNGHRVVFDHHLTHDDLEAHLAYAVPGDLVWRDAVGSDIPLEKHKNANQMEDTIKQGTFWDFEKLGQSMAAHFGAVSVLPRDRKELNAAAKAVIGRWTDGIVTLSVEPGHKLGWSCVDRNHPLNLGERIHGHSPDWWNFAAWRLHLMNNKHKCGTHVGVMRVDERELHVDANAPHRLVTVFRRIST